MKFFARSAAKEREVKASSAFEKELFDVKSKSDFFETISSIILSYTSVEIIIE